MHTNCRSESRSISKLQMDIELKQARVLIWKKKKLLFLNIISLYIETLGPSFHKPQKSSSIKFFGLLSEPVDDFPFHRYHDEGQDMLSRIVTGDESWVHHYQSETQWKHPALPAKKSSRWHHPPGKWCSQSSGITKAYCSPHSSLKDKLQMPTLTITSSGNFVRPFNGSDQD
jgi:hypothetical protein